MHHDFLIPTFEQFRYLRALNKAKRQEERSTTTAITKDGERAWTTTTTTDTESRKERNISDPSTTKTNPRNQIVIVSFPQSFHGASQKTVVDPDEDDDSATEVEYPSPPPTETSKRTKHEAKQQNETGDNNPSKPSIIPASKTTSSNPPTAKRTGIPILRHPFPFPPSSTTKRNRGEKAPGPFGPADKMLTLELWRHPASSLSTKKAVPRHDDSSPEHEVSRPHWLQRKRKRKLQQMKLSFTKSES